MQFKPTLQAILVIALLVAVFGYAGQGDYENALEIQNRIEARR